MRAAYQTIFVAANTRLADLSDERCRDIETAQIKTLRFLGPKPPMLRQLLKTMSAEPVSSAWRDRCHHTMRRLFTSMLKGNQRPESFQTAINAFIDGQASVAKQWLTVEVYLRPWGER